MRTTEPRQHYYYFQNHHHYQMQFRPDITVGISDVLPLLNHSTSKRSLACVVVAQAPTSVAEIVAEAAK